MYKIAVSAFCVFILSACSHQPKISAPKPLIRSIAIIPATTPKRYTLENVSALQFVIPLAATANYLDSKEKAKTFNEVMKSQQPSLADDLTSAVAANLRGYGYEVQILGDVPRPADKVDDVDYDKVSTSADAVLHVKLSEVGLFSPRSSTSYLPRVNARGTLFVKGRDDDLYDEEIVYGVDARKGSIWSIAADDRFAYPSFEAVVSNIDDVRKAFDSGVREISKKMSEQIRDSIN